MTAMSHQRFRVFTEEINRAAREHLAARGKVAREEYRLRVEECPVHGPLCARVTIGMLREHFDVFLTEPATAASLLLATVLPPPLHPAGSGSVLPIGHAGETGGHAAGGIHGR